MIPDQSKCPWNLAILRVSLPLLIMNDCIAYQLNGRYWEHVYQRHFYIIVNPVGLYIQPVGFSQYGIYPRDWCQTQFLRNLVCHNLSFTCPIALRFYTKHSTATAISYARYCKDWTDQTSVIAKRDFTKFYFKMVFGVIPCIVITPCCS